METFGGYKRQDEKKKLVDFACVRVRVSSVFFVSRMEVSNQKYLSVVPNCI